MSLRASAVSPGFCRLARFPFTVRPGDWFKTRPNSVDVTKPVPRCREVEALTTFQPAREETLAKEDQGGDVIVARLPTNYKFGPVFNVAVRNRYGVWQLLVEVPSICNDLNGGNNLRAFVVISNGITQWARWQCNTGDPIKGDSDPIPTDSDNCPAMG